MRNTAENSPVLFTQELVEKCRALIVAKKLALSLSLSLWDHLLGMAGTRYISIYAQRATCSCHDDDAAAQMRSTSLPLPQTNIPGSFISCAIFSLFSRFFFSTNNRWISFVFFLFFFWRIDVNFGGIEEERKIGIYGRWERRYLLERNIFYHVNRTRETRLAPQDP